MCVYIHIYEYEYIYIYIYIYRNIITLTNEIVDPIDEMIFHVIYIYIVEIVKLELQTVCSPR